MSQRSFSFLLNPASGDGAAPAAVVPVARLLRDSGATVDVTYSPGPKAMGAHVDAAVARGDVVVSVGGDGMLSSLAGLVSVADGTLAVVPAGRATTSPGCSACLKPPRTSPGCCSRLRSGTWTWSGSPCQAPSPRVVAGSVYCGVDTRAGEIVDRAHRLPKKAQYPYAALRALATYQPGRFAVSVDGVEQEYAAATVVVANSAFYGKGMKIAPAAAVEDGVLDVVVIEAASKLALMRALPKVYDGAHVDLPEVTVMTGLRVELRADAARPVPVGGDGEPLGSLPALSDPPAVIEVLPGALPVIA